MTDCYHFCLWVYQGDEKRLRVGTRRCGWEGVTPEAARAGSGHARHIRQADRELVALTPEDLVPHEHPIRGSSRWQTECLRSCRPPSAACTPRRPALRATRIAPHHHLRVVIQAPPRHTAEVFERADVTLNEDRHVLTPTDST